MTHDQIIEADKALECMKEARKHLEIAMYYLGKIPDEDKASLRQIYELICLAQDVAANEDSIVKCSGNGGRYDIQIWIM